MRNARRSKGVPHSITLPGRAHTYLIILIATALGVSGTSTALASTAELPVYMLPLLGIVAVTSAGIGIMCMRHMSDIVVTFGPSVIEIAGPSGKTEVPWSKVSSVRVVGPTGSIADDPMTPPEKRIGLAVFLKSGKDDDNDSRTEASDADIIIASGTQATDGDTFVHAAQAITKAVRNRTRKPGERAPAIAGGSRRTGIRSKAA